MTDQVELAIVGAGPAGLEAAIAAAEAGVEVTLIDSNPLPGGQYFKQLPAAFSTQTLTNQQRLAQTLLNRFNQTGVRLLSGTVVWGAFPAPADAGWLLTLHGDNAPHRLQARALILATGAYDRPVPFPGWTLPGVMTAGAVQILLRNQRVLPGRRVLLSGSGPVQLAVAAQLVQAGAEVVGLLEGAATARWRGLRQARAMWGQWTRWRRGWHYWRALRRAGVNLQLGWAVVAARGHTAVEEAVIARLDGEWRPIPGTEVTVANIDTLVVGYGFIPATQLSQLLGCRHVFRPEQGGYVPARDDNLQTSLPGVYAAGDGAGVGGVNLSRLEGRLAGIAAARQLGRLDAAAAQAAQTRLQPGLARERRFARMLGQLFTPGPGLYTLATPDTPLCRCEAVPLAEIQAAIAGGARTANQVKGLTRAGMGSCQGRMCCELVARTITQEIDNLGPYPECVEAAGVFTPRPPLFPLPLSALAEAAKE